MNWKNVLYLLRVERKSGRLVRGAKKTHYQERGIKAYWPYWVAVIIGIAGGFLADWLATSYSLILRFSLLCQDLPLVM